MVEYAGEDPMLPEAVPMPQPPEPKEEVEEGELEEPDHNPRTTYKDDNERTATDMEGLAREVLAGKWGAGQERRQALADAGFDPNKVQKEVVRIVNDNPDT